MKLSYSSVSNVQQLFKKHNNFIQSKKTKTKIICSCRVKNKCQLNWSYKIENDFYRCISLTKNDVKKV